MKVMGIDVKSFVIGALFVMFVWPFVSSQIARLTNKGA